MQAAGSERQQNATEIQEWCERFLRTQRFSEARVVFEAAFEELKTHLGLLAAQLPDIVWTTNLDLRLTSAGGAGLKTLNVLPHQLIGRGLFECFQSAELTDPAIAAHRQAVNGVASHFEIEWTGSAYKAQVQPMRGRDGTILGTVGAALDV